MYQISFEDLERSNNLMEQPGRTAFIDESGNLGFDFDPKDPPIAGGGPSLYYVVCAVIVRNESIGSLEAAAEKIRQSNGFQTEMKSNSVGRDHRRRMKVLSELLAPDYSVVLLIADKKRFLEDSSLGSHRGSFKKYLHQRLYESLYASYPKLKIVEDEYGSSEFQRGFREYVRSHRPQETLYNEYDFDYADSRYSPIVQIAGFIAGSVRQRLLDDGAPDALRIFGGKLRGIVRFPNEYPGSAGKGADQRFDRDIYDLADHCAADYINAHRDEKDEDVKLRVQFLRYLLQVVRIVGPERFVTSNEAIRVLSEFSEGKLHREFLYRRIIAPLRDAGVIIASSGQGYKLPACVEDIYAYANQTNGIVGPMLSRIVKCRELILRQTDGALDIFDDPALRKIKRYFGGD